MQMTDRYREGIRSVMRRWSFVETEQHFDHVLHLTLVGAAVSDHRAFHFRRCVFDNVAPGFDGSEHRHTTGMPQLQRAASIHTVKEVLHRDTLRPPRREELSQFAVDSCETLRKAVACSQRDRAAGDETISTPIGLDASIARTSRAGVDPEDPHAREASISFSSMSKFAQTCCTSSCSSSASISFSMTCASLPCSLT